LGKDSVVMVRCLVMKLSKKDHTYFLQKLSKQRAKLVKGASDTIANDLSVIDGELADTIDRSTVETERSFMLRLRERERKLINKIDEALSRLNKDEFGQCEECGDNIGLERLKARPVATLCINCKEDEEKRES